jgi:hypothetical protein
MCLAQAVPRHGLSDEPGIVAYEPWFLSDATWLQTTILPGYLAGASGKVHFVVVQRFFRRKGLGCLPIC